MPFRIVIDTRHIRDFGIGTYIRNLVWALAKLDSENHYILVSYPADVQELSGLPANFEIAVYKRQDSGLASQVTFPLYLRRFWADLYHIPLNVVSLFMPKPYVVTVHDMSSLLFEVHPSAERRFRLYQFRQGAGARRPDSRRLERDAARRRGPFRHRFRKNPPDLQRAGSQVSRGCNAP